MGDREAMIAAIRKAVCEALDHVSLDVIRSSEFFGTEAEGKVTLTCGHTHETPVGIWEPEIDREGNRCRSYSTHCPACAEDASFVMVEQIEDLEAEVEMLRGAVAEAVYMLDPEAEDVLKGAGIYRIVLAHEQAGGFLPDDLKYALQEAKGEE